MPIEPTEQQLPPSRARYVAPQQLVDAGATYHDSSTPYVAPVIPPAPASTETFKKPGCAPVTMPKLL